MRRKPAVIEEVKPYWIRKVTPLLFWKKCCKCGCEVRREPVVKICVYWFEKLISKDLGVVLRSGGKEVDVYYYCYDCCESISNAENEFIKDYLPLYRS